MRQDEGTSCSRLGAMGFTENDVISMLNRVFASSDPRIEVGIGDDGAVVSGSPHQVITTDMAVEDVHFRKAWSSAFEIGRKITAANLADIYAMGAKPDYLVVALAVTGDEELSSLEQLATGIAHEANLGGASVVGGDLVRGETVTISITAVGGVDVPILRSGAKAGDSIFISSLPGWSAAGLALMKNGGAIVSEAEKKAAQAFCSPDVDYSGDYKGASSLCDVSDGLITQSQQIAEASGVQLVFDPILFSQCQGFAELQELATSMDEDVHQWIFAGGEDHIFLATGIELPGVCVGKVCDGAGVSGLEMKKAPEIWHHFN